MLGTCVVCCCLLVGEGRAAWKKRWCHIDGTTGYLYWWTKPDGKVLGAVPLLDNTVLTTLPAPEFGFRLSWGNRFRDFRADSQQSQKMWEKHLGDEIASRSGGKQKKKKEERPYSEDVVEPVAAAKANDKSQERIRELEAEILILKQKVKALETENQELKNDDEAPDPEALKMLNEMNLEDTNIEEDGLEEKIDDLTFQLNSAKKRLKAANETIKLQAQRIQLLEGK